MVISILLEWENAILSELDRTRLLLQAVFSQTQGRSEQFELLVLHNSKQVEKEFISTFISDVIEENGFVSTIPIAVINVDDAHYFQLKNRGVELAKGEKIIFFDSDIIPQEGWFDAIMEASNQYPNAIISGCSYIDNSDLTGKAFALSWFFPLPPADTQLNEVSLIFSNNYLAPRDLMLSNPYPHMEEGVTRGADTLLWKRLRNQEIKLMTHNGARASHPAPNGMIHVCKRGFAEGRDDYMRLFEKEFAVKHPMLRFFKIYLYRCRKVIKSTLINGKRVNLKPYEIPAAMGLMLFYYQLYLIGALITKLLPSVAKTSWRI
jgi:glycosyltransferase involved in cell wall biosynthesis